MALFNEYDNFHNHTVDPCFVELSAESFELFHPKNNSDKISFLKKYPENMIYINTTLLEQKEIVETNPIASRFILNISRLVAAAASCRGSRKAKEICLI